MESLNTRSVPGASTHVILESQGKIARGLEGWCSAAKQFSQDHGNYY